MSYYTLPKINHQICLEPEYQNYPTNPYISHTLLHHYTDVKKMIDRLYKSITMNTENPKILDYESMIHMVNPHEYIFSNVPGTKMSVSKLKPESNVFYDFMEISNTLNIFDHFTDVIRCLYIGNHIHSTMEYISMIRENNHDSHMYFNNITELSNSVNIEHKTIDFIYYENTCSGMDKNGDVDFIYFLTHMLRVQKENGLCIIKINQLFYKPIIDLLYLLSSLYERVSIIKPSTSNVTSFEKYIVCKNFIFQFDKNDYYYNNLFLFLSFLHNTHPNVNKSTPYFISHIIKGDIPYYFINKIEESNIIIGQQQLEALDLIVSIFKNKNSEDKMETLKKVNLQKCIYWC
jgi:hypothetical protein